MNIKYNRNRVDAEQSDHEHSSWIRQEAYEKVREILAEGLELHDTKQGPRLVKLTKIRHPACVSADNRCYERRRSHVAAFAAQYRCRWANTARGQPRPGRLRAYRRRRKLSARSN
jgi:hypothetical protein